LSVVVVSLDHESTPLSILEAVAVGDARVGKVLRTLCDQANIEESVVLSTCLRTEVYAVVNRFHDAVREIQEVIAGQGDLVPAVIEVHATVRFDDDVARHLFEVASGLRSAVPGESEVLGQVKRAWEAAAHEHASGPVLAELFRHATHTGKRVRSETGISRGTTSFSHGAIQLAESALEGGLGGSRVVVVGAGEMGSGLVTGLRTLAPERRPQAIVVVNRTEARAQALVRASSDSGVVSAEISDLVEHLASADVVFAAVDAGDRLIGAAQLERRQRGRALVVVDLGMPRVVDPDLASLAGITLLDLEDLRTAVHGAMDERRAEATQAGVLVDEELHAYRAAARARGAAPVIAALRQRLEVARAQELERHRSQFGDLDDAQWSRVDAASRTALAKLLHEPTVVLKDTAGTPRGERLVEALRTLFDL
jgi:glutamyl-tRNA reductase